MRIGLLAGIMLSGACGWFGKDEPAVCVPSRTLDFVVETSDRVNLDDEGRSLPTQIRLYQLKSVAKLENAEFEDLWLRADETLGEDLIKVEDLTLFPSEKQKRSFEAEKDTAFVIGVALFRKPAGRDWHADFELPTRCDGAEGGGKGPLHRRFLLEDYRIEVVVDGGAAPVLPTASDRSQP